MQHLKWISSLMKEHRWSYLICLLVLLIEGISSLAIVGLQKWIIDDVFMDGNFDMLMPIIMMFAGVFLCYSLFFILSPYLYFKNGTYLHYKFSRLLMSYLHKIPIKHLQNERTAKFVHYFTNDAVNAAKMIGTDLPIIYQQSIMVIVLMGVIGFINLPMLLFVCLRQLMLSLASSFLESLEQCQERFRIRSQT